MNDEIMGKLENLTSLVMSATCNIVKIRTQKICNDRGALHRTPRPRSQRI
jgi:hypothetical protein